MNKVLVVLDVYRASALDDNKADTYKMAVPVDQILNNGLVEKQVHIEEDGAVVIKKCSVIANYDRSPRFVLGIEDLIDAIDEAINVYAIRR